ncbi:hypothetical protein AAG906_002158 [Vitis piasezkii]
MTQEISGEDPFIVGLLMLQALCAYDIDSWLNIDRRTFDARVIVDNQNYLNDSKVDLLQNPTSGWEVNQFLFLSMQLMHGNLKLIKQVVEVSGGPMILVVLVVAILTSLLLKIIPNLSHPLGWLSREQGGHAIADVVFGKYNPGGRLPVTWYEADYVACLETHIMDAKTPSPQ